MMNFFNTVKRKLTLGLMLTIIGSSIFAIFLTYPYVYFFDLFPVKGELEVLDLSYLAIVLLFRLMFRAFLEYLLNDKFSMPLFGTIGKGVVEKDVITLSTEKNGSKGSSVENTSKGKETATKQLSRGEEFTKFTEEKYKVAEKNGECFKRTKR